MHLADIEPLCKKLGVGPTTTRPNGDPCYTLPTIYDPNTQTAVTDSAAIVRYLDSAYPGTGPTLVPRELDAFVQAVQTAFETMVFAGGHLVRLMVPAIHDVLVPCCNDGFRRIQEALHGPMEDLVVLPGSVERTEQWKGLEKVFSAVASWLKAESDGTERLFFLGGDRICHADLVVAGFLQFIKKVAPPEEWEAHVKTWDGGRWERFMNTFQLYDTVDAGVALDLQSVKA